MQLGTHAGQPLSAVNKSEKQQIPHTTHAEAKVLQQATTSHTGQMAEPVADWLTTGNPWQQTVPVSKTDQCFAMLGDEAVIGGGRRGRQPPAQQA